MGCCSSTLTTAQQPLGYSCPFDCKQFPEWCFNAEQRVGGENGYQLIESVVNDIGWSKTHTKLLDEYIQEIFDISLPEVILIELENNLGIVPKAHFLNLPIYHCVRQCYMRNKIENKMCHRWLKFNYVDEPHSRSRRNRIIIPVTFMGVDYYCGKTAIIEQYAMNSFLTANDPTSEENYTCHKRLFNGLNIVFQIKDTGSYGYDSLAYQWRLESRMIVFVYDVRNEMSFDGFDHFLLKLKKERPNIWNNSNIMDILITGIDKNEFENENESDFANYKNKIGIILCANCCDTKDGKQKRKISTEDGIKMAKKYNIPYVETSAFVNCNINTLFEMIALEWWYTCCVKTCPYTIDI